MRRLQPERTAGPSTALRSGRDDNVFYDATASQAAEKAFHSVVTYGLKPVPFKKLVFRSLFKMKMPFTTQPLRL